jgi:Ca-activated chloride channel family protein
MVNRLLLLSDGEATAGIKDVEGFRAIGARVRNMGASISAVGVDVDYNERVMNVLAVESNGRHHFVENESALGRVFDQELDSLSKSLAKESEVAVDLAPGVEVERVFDRTFRREGNKLIVPMGSFTSGEEKTLLVSLRVPRGAGGERPIADIRMTYDDLTTTAAARGECVGKLAALLTSDGTASTEIDPFVQARILRSQTATALSEANDLFNRGRGDEAKRRLSDRLGAIKKERELALSRAPAPAKDKLGADFERQEQALGAASSGFAQAEAAPATGTGDQPASPAPPSQTRAGKAQVRKNSVEALDMGF